MSTRLLAAGAVLAATLSGCAPAPVATVRTEVLVCPTELPSVGCPDWPAPPTTLIELEEAHARGKAAHAQCSAAVGAFHQAYEACSDGP